MTTKIQALAAAALALAALAAGQPTAHSEPGPSCVDDSPHVCAPGNPEGKPAGCFDPGGVLVAEFPCKPWAPSDGYEHGDGTITYPGD